MSNIKSKVMTAANRLVKGGMRRSLAMVKAWALAKADGLRIKVRGTSRRQNELEAVAKYRPESVTVQLRREPHNSHDSNAVAVRFASALSALSVIFSSLSVLGEYTFVSSNDSVV